MQDTEKNLEALRFMLIEALKTFAKYGQCGKLKEGREVLDSQNTERVRGLFQNMCVQARDAPNLAAMVAVAQLARMQCLRDNFWIDSHRSVYSEFLVAVCFLAEQQILETVCWRDARGFRFL